MIVDEFHRLNEPFSSLVQSGSIPEITILITSTLRYYLQRDIRKPMTGTFLEKKVDLVSPLTF